MKIIVLSLFILELFIGLTVVIGADDDDDDDNDDIEDIERETRAEMDSYVDRDYPYSNYGGVSYLKVGGSGGHYATYIYFDFDDEPDDWEEVEISLDFFYVYTTVDVVVYLASSEWDELAITYTYRPIVGGFIKTFRASTEGTYKFDVSDVVEDLLDDDEEGMAICLNVSSTNAGYIYITSDEGAYFEDDAPLLIWTYNIVPDIDYGLIIVIILLIVVPIATASILIILYFTKWRKRAPRKPVVPSKEVVAPTPPSKVEPSPPPSRVEPSPPPTSIKICESCGNPLPPNAKEYCPNCGKKILQDAIGFCPNCGNEVPKNATFCEMCGREID